MDLAEAHVVALERLMSSASESNFEVFNVGTGVGSSVLDVIKSFEKASGQDLNYKIVDRRSGDVVAAFADTTKANTVMGWKSKRTLDEALKDAWNWEKSQANK
jgi:UDP-glucose 4-epimerase